MNTVIIACKTISDELTYSIKKTGVPYSVAWLESGLHNTPKKLNERLAETFDSISADRVLLAMGFCGNAIQGIKAGGFELIIPYVDDCISLLLGSIKNRAEISSEFAAYFLTEGWLRGERNISVEYKYAVDKFGEEEAKSLAAAMFGHYRTIALLDTGLAPIAPLLNATEYIAKILELEQKVIPATLSYIEQLLTGPWTTDKFIIKRPGEEVTASDLVIRI